MKKVRVEEAVGMIICHDMTKVVPGEFKGPAFKKGHVIRKEDISVLKSMGKEHIYADSIPEGFIHENECAERIARAICSIDDFDFTDVSEGKVAIMPRKKGVLKIDTEKLYELNRIEDVAISTIYDKTVVNKGQKVAAERIIPLYTKKENIERVEEICKEDKPIKVKPFTSQRVHLIITGNEVYSGIINDKFLGAIGPKIIDYGCNLVKVVKVPDDKDRIKSEIRKSADEGAEIIICTGGMSVDEDDMTPLAIKEEIDKVLVHGIPVQPGNMFLLGYKENIPVMGLPAAIIFYKYTIFDIVFPLIACRDEMDKDFFLRLSIGGLCHFCTECHYPNCTFGKGR